MKKAFKEIRKLAKSRASKIIVVEGHSPPKEKGEGFYWETKGGAYIRYPNAYSKKGFSNMIYCPSSKRVEVGVEWLAKNMPEVIAAIWIERFKGNNVLSNLGQATSYPQSFFVKCFKNKPIYPKI